MRQYGIRIANVALFALCSFLTASVFNQIAAEMLIPVNTTATQSIAAQPVSAPSWADRKAVVDRNLFGSKLNSDALVAPPVVEDLDLEETALPVKLLGTVAGSDPAVSTAAISDTTLRTHQILRIGDFLEGRDEVRVTAIERKRIVLQNGLRLEELLLDEDAPRVAPPRAAARKNIRRRRAAVGKPGDRSKAQRNAENLENRVRELESELSGGGSGNLAAQMALLAGNTPSQAASSKGGDNLAEIASKARPKFENGAVAGLEFNGIDGGILAQQGLRNGDVVTEVNGMPINSISATSQVLNELTTVQDLNVKVTGPNGERTIHVPASEVAKYLR